jgi:hypothetical protein
MRFKKAAPGDGGERRCEQFIYTRTQPGLKGAWCAWCAHEPHWFKVHEHNEHQRGTKVCLTWFTDGAIPCPRCRPGVVPTTCAYVPVWREEDLKPCMVIVHESAADVMQGLSFGVFALVGCVEKGASVYVKRSEVQKPWNPTQEFRRSPCDIAVSLLTMWDYPSLNQWCATADRRAKQDAGALPLPTRLRLSVPPPTTTAEALAVDAERKAPATWGELVDTTLGAAKRRVERVEKNGKHKPNAEGGDK